MNEAIKELYGIIEKFSESEYELINIPSRSYLYQNGDKQRLIAAIEQANKECGSCGCEFDPLYKRALELKHLM